MYPLRSITFVAEFLHPRAQHPVEHLQSVHHRLFSESELRYTNFQVVPQGSVLSNPSSTPGALSTVTLSADRIRVQEQNTGISRDDFGRRVATVVRAARAELAIPALVAQQYVVQSLVNPRASVNADQFMKGSVLQLRDDQLGGFDREPDLFGVRMRFPARADAPGTFQVRIENFQQDPRSLFVEVVGVFQRATTGDPSAGIDEDLRRSYDFMDGPVLDLITEVDGREHGKAE